MSKAKKTMVTLLLAVMLASGAFAVSEGATKDTAEAHNLNFSYCKHYNSWWADHYRIYLRSDNRGGRHYHDVQTKHYPKEHSQSWFATVNCTGRH